MIFIIDCHRIWFGKLLLEIWIQKIIKCINENPQYLLYSKAISASYSFQPQSKISRVNGLKKKRINFWLRLQSISNYWSKWTYWQYTMFVAWFWRCMSLIRTKKYHVSCQKLFFIAAWDNEMMEDVVDDSTPLYTGCSPFQNKSRTW